MLRVFYALYHADTDVVDVQFGISRYNHLLDNQKLSDVSGRKYVLRIVSIWIMYLVVYFLIIFFCQMADAVAAAAIVSQPRVRQFGTLIYD